MPSSRADFTVGSIPRKLMLFSLPILAANLLQASMQLVNGLWVGNLLGSDAFAAVTIATTVLQVVLAFVLGLNNATLTIFAQLRGAEDREGIDAALGAFVIILGGLSVLLGAAGFLHADWLLALLNTPDAVMGPARDYLRINLAGTLALVGYNFIGSMLRGFGDSRTPLYFVLMATILAALMVPAATRWLGLGVAGAAWAMVLAQAAAFAYSLFHLARRPGVHAPRPRMPRLEHVRAVLELGIPSGVQMIVIYAGLTVLLSLVNSFGEGVVAGFGAAQRLDSIVLLPGVALGMAVNAMVAQNIGANRWDRVGQVTRTGVVFNLAAMAVIAAGLVLAARLGEDGIALGIGLSFLLSSLFSAAYYRWGGWRSKRLFTSTGATAGG